MMIIRVPELTAIRPIVQENGESSQEMRSWAQLLTDRALIVGTGTPETFIAALQGALYMDDMGLDGNILYVKRDSNIFGDKTLGCIAV